MVAPVVSPNRARTVAVLVFLNPDISKVHYEIKGKWEVRMENLLHKDL